MPLTGDFDKLDRWLENLSELVSPGSLSRVSTQMANAAIELVGRDFSEQRGPFGARWAAKKKPDGRPVGQGRTGKLSRYRIKHVDGTKFHIGSDAAYATYFHKGTRSMKARPIVPSGGRLPREWRGAFTTIWLEHCSLVLRGKR